MDLRSSKRNKRFKPNTNVNSADVFDDDGFYSAEYNEQPAVNDAYYDDYSQQNYNDPNYGNQAQDNDSWNEAAWDTNEDDYYAEQAPPPKKESRFVRPRPKQSIPAKKATSFKPVTPQTFQPNATSSHTQQPPVASHPSRPAPTRPTPTGNFNENLIAQSVMAGLTAAGVGGIGSTIGSQVIEDGIRNVIPPGILSLGYYKYYFRVHNDYVLKKLSRLLCPFLNMKVKDWKRKRINEVSDDNTAPPPKIESAGFASYSYQPPIYDINAPDGYLPLMAIVTYIVIMGFVVGTQSSSENGDNSITFSPQILIATGSSAFVLLCVEVLLMKIGFYLIGSVAEPPYWLDIVCYTGYKLVFVTINLVINLIFDSLILYYIISVTTGIFAAVFMIQTLRPYFRDLSDFASGAFLGHADEPTKTRKIFLGVAGITQILFIQLMGRYTSV